METDLIETQKLLSTSEAAGFLAVSQRTLWAWTKQGRLACVKIDRTKRYRMRDLMNLIEANLTAVKSGNSGPEQVISSPSKK